MRRGAHLGLREAEHAVHPVGRGERARADHKPE